MSFAPIRGLLVLLAAAALAGGCSVNPATGRRQLILLSSDQVAQMGEDAKPQLIEQYGGEIASPTLRAYVAEVGGALAALTEGDAPSNPWEFFALDDDIINAFALPGGKVFISRGLLQRMETEAELAGVLGHEVGHVAARHVDERVSQALSLDFGLQILGTATDSQLAAVGAQLFGQGYLLKFGRDQELEADALGLRYMVRAGYDPGGMVDLLTILKESAGSARTAEFLSTHPYPERRLAQAERLIAEQYRAAADDPDARVGRDEYRRRALDQVGGPVAGLAPAQWCALCRAR